MLYRVIEGYVGDIWGYRDTGKHTWALIRV